MELFTFAQSANPLRNLLRVLTIEAMARKAQTTEEWVRARFPNTAARKAADAAVELLTDAESMARHIAVWLDTYNTYV